MIFKKLGLFLFIAAAFMVITPVSAQTATFDSVTSPETAQPGGVVTVDLVISYSFDTLTTISPGVHDPVAEDYIVEDGLEVTGTGTESISLSFNAPTVEGEYVFVVDLYAQDGTEWVYTGQDDYYITLTVGVGGGSTSAWSATVEDVSYPSVVKPGESMDVEITVEYDFPQSTNMEVGVSEPETGEAINYVSVVKNGARTEKFTVTINAPEEEGAYEVGADVLFETENGWDYTEGGVMTFTVIVEDSGSSGGIPGFPWTSMVLGALMVMGFLQYSGRKTPIF
jgi:spore coat protein U-like protein